MKQMFLVFFARRTRIAVGVCLGIIAAFSCVYGDENNVPSELLFISADPDSSIPFIESAKDGRFSLTQDMSFRLKTYVEPVQIRKTALADSKSLGIKKRKFRCSNPRCKQKWEYTLTERPLPLTEWPNLRVIGEQQTSWNILPEFKIELGLLFSSESNHPIEQEVEFAPHGISQNGRRLSVMFDLLRAAKDAGIPEDAAIVRIQVEVYSNAPLFVKWRNVRLLTPTDRSIPALAHLPEQSFRQWGGHIEDSKRVVAFTPAWPSGLPQRPVTIQCRLFYSVSGPLARSDITGDMIITQDGEPLTIPLSFQSNAGWLEPQLESGTMVRQFDLSEPSLPAEAAGNAVYVFDVQTQAIDAPLDYRQFEWWERNVIPIELQNDQDIRPTRTSGFTFTRQVLEDWTPDEIDSAVFRRIKLLEGRTFIGSDQFYVSLKGILGVELAQKYAGALLQAADVEDYLFLFPNGAEHLNFHISIPPGTELSPQTTLSFGALPPLCRARLKFSDQIIEIPHSFYDIPVNRLPNLTTPFLLELNYQGKKEEMIGFPMPVLTMGLQRSTPLHEFQKLRMVVDGEERPFPLERLAESTEAPPVQGRSRLVLLLAIAARGGVALWFKRVRCYVQKWGRLLCQLWLATYGRVPDVAWMIVWLGAGIHLYGRGGVQVSSGENYYFTFGGLMLVPAFMHANRALKSRLLRHCRQSLQENYPGGGKPFFIGALVLLIIVASLMSVQPETSNTLETVAEQLAVLIYYFLVAGVGIEFLTFRRDEQVGASEEGIDAKP